MKLVNNNTMTSKNGFATKNDIKKLGKVINQRFQQVDKRFEQVDKRFAQVDKRFEQVDKRFQQVNNQFSFFKSELKEEWNFFKSDTFREFEHRWQQKIDPILKEIEIHREKELLNAEQYRRTQDLMEKIAKKVGADID